MIMHPHRLLLLAGASLLALGVATQCGQAQSMDYGALEQLYGEPVTTSATGKPQQVSQVPANMEIITQDDIRRSGADNIPDILEFVTGIDVRRYGFGDVSVSVRGMNQPQSPRLLVLVNGRQVYQDDYGYVEWAAIPVELEQIRQIEVVKGPNSALFGFNAVGGVINIITFNPLYDNLNEVTARTGTQSLAEGDVVTTVRPAANTGVLVGVGGYLAHEFANPYASSIAAENPERGEVNADGKTKIAPGVELSLSASESSSDALGETPIGSIWNEYWRTNSVRAGVSAESGIGTLNFDIFRNELFYSASTSGVTVPWRNVVYVVRANDIVKINGNNTVRLGVEFRDNTVEDVGFAFIGGQAGYSVYSANAMWNWQITPKLSLTNAVRGDYLTLRRSGTQPTADGYYNSQFDNTTIFEPSYNSGLVYQPTLNDTFRLMAAQGVGVPSLIQFGYAGGADPDLRPTLVDNYELDYDRKLDAISSVVRTALYYQTNRDLLITIGGPVPAGLLSAPSQNIGSADEFGIEIGLKGHSASGLHWDASYSLGKVTEHVITNQGAIPDAPFDYMHGTPENVVIVGGGYSWNKFEFDVHARWQSEYRDYFSPSLFLPLESRLISNYVTAAARLAYNIKKGMVAALSVQQLDSSSLVTTAALPVDRRIIASFTAHF